MQDYGSSRPAFSLSLSLSHLQPGRGQANGLRIQSNPIECMLVQMHALYPDELNSGHGEEEENEGWQCVDQNDGEAIYSLEGLPSDFIKNNQMNLESANSWLSVSSSTKIKGNGKDKLKVNHGALVSVTKGNKTSGRYLEQEGRRLAVEPGSSVGIHTVLLVRVIDQTGDAPSKTASELSADFFSDPVNLVSESVAVALSLYVIHVEPHTHFSLYLNRDPSTLLVLVTK